jgi:hypothetical protein
VDGDGRGLRRWDATLPQYRLLNDELERSTERQRWVRYVKAETDGSYSQDL